MPPCCKIRRHWTAYNCGGLPDSNRCIHSINARIVTIWSSKAIFLRCYDSYIGSSLPKTVTTILLFSLSAVCGRIVNILPVVEHPPVVSHRSQAAPLHPLAQAHVRVTSSQFPWSQSISQDEQEGPAQVEQSYINHGLKMKCDLQIHPSRQSIHRFLEQYTLH